MHAYAIGSSNKYISSMHPSSGAAVGGERASWRGLAWQQASKRRKQAKQRKTEGFAAGCAHAHGSIFAVCGVTHGRNSMKTKLGCVEKEQKCRFGTYLVGLKLLVVTFAVTDD